MDRVVYVVPHCHWDREWYQPHELFRWRLVQMIDELLDYMEAHPEYRCFNLDGQSIVIADYLELRPEQEGRLRALIEQGRILIGPWWVQPDEFLPSGESHIRSLQRGIRFAERMGGCLRVGHCADQFGHIAQMPQIMRQLGLTSACLWRGVPDAIPGWSFWWEAPDGTRVPALYLRNSYSSGWRLPKDPDELIERTRRQERDLRPGLPALLMNGTDHSRMERHVPEALRVAAGRGYDFRLATLAEYEAAVLSAGIDDVVHKGELRSPDRSNVLVGVLSTRMPIKLRDFEITRALERYAEPLELLGRLHGGPDGLPALRHAWSLALENTPHDSICGCSVDQVHREMFPRYDRAEQLAMQVARECASHVTRRMAVPEPGGLSIFRPVAGAAATLEADVPAEWAEFDALHLPGGQLVPFALEPGKQGLILQHEAVSPRGVLRHLDFLREQRYDVHAIEKMEWELAGSHLRVTTTVGPDITVVDEDGFREEVRNVALSGQADSGEVLVLESQRATLRAALPPAEAVGLELVVPVRLDGATPPARPPSARRIATEWFEVRLRGHRLEITDLASGRRFRDVCRFISEGDRGDEYNADILSDPVSEPVGVTLHGTLATAAYEELRYTLTFDLPARLTRSRKRRSPKERVLQPISVTVRLWRGLRRIDFHVAVTNLARDHRLRALFPLPGSVTTVITENHFHIAERPTEPPPWNGQSAEQPPTTFPQKSFAAFEANGTGLAVFNRGLQEGEVITYAGRQWYALTLLRCVGWLSRNDLRSRRGGAGPMIATEDSQLIGTHAFSFALATYEGRWEEAGIQRAAHAFAAPPIGWATNAHEGSLDGPVPLLALEGDAVLSAAHRSEETGEPVVRLYAGPKGGPVRLRVPAAAGVDAERVDLLERNGVPLAGVGDGWLLQLRPWEIATVRLRTAGRL